MKLRCLLDLHELNYSGKPILIEFEEPFEIEQYGEKLLIYSQMVYVYYCLYCKRIVPMEEVCYGKNGEYVSGKILVKRKL